MFLFIEGLYESEGGLKMKNKLNSSSVMMFYLLLANLSFRAPYTATGSGVETCDQTAGRSRTSCDRVSVGGSVKALGLFSTTLSSKKH